MFKHTSHHLLMGLVASAVLTVSTSVWADEQTPGLLVDSDGNPVMSSSDECVKTESASKSHAKCGGVFDADGDGVTDDKDKCPNTPKGVKVDENGCPLDSDKDGVPDYEDKCPNNTPIEISAGVDKSGCPLDSDGDGVADYKDKCPGTPAGTPVDADGCPLKGEVIIKTTITEGQVKFDFDKVVIKPEGKKELDKLVNFINGGQYQVNSMSLVGHTDSVGTERYNQKLSERRAQAVANYLRSQGVNVEMDVSGKGESSPLPDVGNATRAARAKQRRVEITINAAPKQ